MRYLVFIASKLVSGFFIGIGFFLVAAIFAWATSKYYENEVAMDEDGFDMGCYSYNSCDEDPDLSVNIVSERITESEFILLGEVLNKGNHDWSMVSLKVELFDENGIFFEECSDYISEKIVAGSKANFKLDCSQCTPIQLASFGSYEVKIVDANGY